MDLIDWSDHYWRRADGAAFSSASAGYVTADHPAYVAWRESGNRPTPYPRDNAGEESDAELARVLLAAGCRDAAAALDVGLARADALKELDPLICQIQRYTRMGEGTAKAQARLVAAMTEINVRYAAGAEAN